MTAQNRTTLKGYFETGDFPTQAQFADLIDSLYHRDDLGWAEYLDNQYTSGSPFTATGDTELLLPNNAATVNNTYAPAGSALYDGTDLVATEGDALLLTIDCEVTPSSGATTYIDFWLETGLGTEIARSTISLAKGEINHHITFTLFENVSAEWAANGAVVKCQANGGGATIHTIKYIIGKTSKAF